MNSPALKEKLNRLTDIIKAYPAVAVAFSGGVDSTFLLKFAHGISKDKVTAVTAVAPNFSPDEIAAAIGFCSGEGIRHVLVDLGDSFLETFADNPENRCYLCKKSIFTKLLSHPGLAGMVFTDGSNKDDSFDFRPGEKALSELGIKSPLLEAGLTKEEIRYASKEIGLAAWDKPALACLASRIPYGEKVTAEKLTAIYSLEKALHEAGFSQVRVRHHGDVARIEVLPGEREKFFDTILMDNINDAAKKAGFTYAALDLSGYKMGNMNK